MPSNIKLNKAKTVNLLPTMRLTQSILKRKFPSVDKPLQIKAPPEISPSKRAFEKYKPWGLFSEFYCNWNRKSASKQAIAVLIKIRFGGTPLYDLENDDLENDNLENDNLENNYLESDNLQIESNELENNDLESEVQLKSTLVIV